MKSIDFVPFWYRRKHKRESVPSILGMKCFFRE